MSRHFDHASDLEQMQRDNAIAELRKAEPDAVATGKCLNCEEPLADGLRWCDKDCVRDWQLFTGKGQRKK